VWSDVQSSCYQSRCWIALFDHSHLADSSTFEVCPNYHNQLTCLLKSSMETSAPEITAGINMTDLNRTAAVVLIAIYLLYMWTQISSTKYSYKPLVQSDDSYEPELDESLELGKSSILCPSAPATPPSSPVSELDNLVEHESYAASQHLASPTRLTLLAAKASAFITLAKTSTWIDKVTPILSLVVSTGLISVCSGYLVTSIDHFVDFAPISKTMTGLVVLPLVGNAAELVSGVMFASRKQTDLAFAVAVGSALQIALFVAPLVVLIAWGMGRDMVLDFTEFEAAGLAASACMFLMLTFDCRCSILKGTWLCAGYTIIA
jgi:Ca2+:H+ antiporter